MRIKKRLLLASYRFAKRLHTASLFLMGELKMHLYYLDFKPRQSDIYIAAFPKSGTTWMQVILYNLLTEGDMSFAHIYDVSPWISNEAVLGRNADRVNRLPEPRIIKTHERYGFYHKNVKGRFIFIYRDGKDVAESFYHHNRHYVDPDLTFGANFDKHFIKGVGKDKSTWFDFNQTWLENKNGLPIFYVSYEQLKLDFDRTVQTIARYLDVPLTKPTLERIRQHASFEYMKAHESKFGARPSKEQRLVFDQFIRHGNTGDGKDRLDARQRQVYEQRYKEDVEPYLKKVLGASNPEGMI